MAPVCTRLGILLSNTPVRDGAAEGKVERFFEVIDVLLLQREDRVIAVEL